MALFKFTKNILAGEVIDIYNYGKLERDFTYVDDIPAVLELSKYAPVKSLFENDTKSIVAPYRIVNVGNGKPIELIKFIETLEEIIGKKAKKNFVEMQAGDVQKTHADIGLLEKIIGFRSTTSIDQGIAKFVQWYKSYYEHK